MAKNFDKLDKATLKALFTQRQFVRVVPILSEISEFTKTNEDATRAWMKSYTDGKKVIDGFNTQMENFNNQLKMFEGNIDNAKQSTMDLIKTIGADFLPKANDFLKWLSEFETGTGKVAVQTLQLSGIMTSLLMSIRAITSLNAVKMGLTLFKSPQYMAILGIATTLGYIYTKMKNIEKQQEKISFKPHFEELKKLEAENKKILKDIKIYEKTLSAIGDIKVSDEWDKTFDIIEKTVNKTKEFQSILTALTKLSQITKNNFKEIEYPDELFLRQSERNKMAKDSIKKLEEAYTKFYSSKVTSGRFTKIQASNMITDMISRDIKSPEDALKRLEEEKKKAEEILDAKTNLINVSARQNYYTDEEIKNEEKRLYLEEIAGTQAETNLNLINKQITSLKDYIFNKEKLQSIDNKILDIERKNKQIAEEFVQSFMDSEGEIQRLFSTLDESILIDVLSQPVKDLEEWKKLMQDMGQTKILQILEKDFKNITDETEKLNLVTSTLFKKYSSTISFLENIITMSKENQKENDKYSEVWGEVEKKASNMKNNIISMVSNQEELNEATNKNTKELEEQIKIRKELILSIIQQKRELKLVGASEEAILKNNIKNAEEQLKVNQKNFNEFTRGLRYKKVTAEDINKKNELELEISNSQIKVAEGKLQLQENYDAKKKEELELEKELTEKKQEYNMLFMDEQEQINYKLKLLNELDLTQLSEIEKMNVKIEKQRILNEEIEKQAKLERERTASVLRGVSQLTSGQSPTISYNMENVADLTNLALSKDFSSITKEQMSDTIGFIGEQYNNISKNVISKEDVNLERKIQTLEMQKELLSDEDDIADKDKEILQAKMDLIDKEAQMQSNEAVTGGVTGGLQSALTALAMGSNPFLAAGIGAMSLVSGLLGASKAERQAEYEREMLQEQKRHTELLEQQNDNLKAIEEYGKISQRFGTQYANKNINQTVGNISKEEEYGYWNSYIPEGGRNESYEYISGTKSFDIAEKELKTYTDLLEEKEFADNRYEELKNESTENMTKEQLASYKAEKSAYKEYTDYLIELDSGFIKSKKELFKGWFGFSFEEVGNDTLEIWQPRTEILNKFIDNAATGFNDLGRSITSTLSTGILNNFIKETSEISKDGGTLDKLQKKMEEVSDAIAEGKDLSTGDYTPLLRDIKGLYKELEAEQKVVNEYSNAFLGNLIDAEVLISNLTDMFGYDIPNAIDSALDETNFIDRYNKLGETIGSSISRKIKQEMIDANYGETMFNLQQQMTDYINSDEILNLNKLSAISSEIQKMTVQSEMDALKLESALSMLEVGDIDYVNQSQGITYETGTSSTLQQIFNNNVSTNIGNLVSNTDKASLTKWGNMIAPYVVQAIETNLKKEA